MTFAGEPGRDNATVPRAACRVTAACQAQLVNVIAPIMTEPGGRAWRQTIFLPFALTARLATGTVLRVEPQSPTYQTQRFGTVPVLDATATFDPDTGQVTVFAVNRDVTGPVEMSVSLAGFGDLEVAEAWIVGGGDPYESNTGDEPNRVQPQPWGSAAVSGSRLTASLPPVAWGRLELDDHTPVQSSAQERRVDPGRQ